MNKTDLKKCYLALPLLCLPLLQGCIPLAVGAVVGGGFVAYKKPHIDTLSQDTSIYRQADRAFGQDRSFGRDSHVVISVTNNNVLLVGQVPNEEQKARAETLVKNIPGVKRVFNQLAIAPVTTGVIRSNDSWITTKVKTELIGTKGLESVRIKVVTENGVVYLMGITSREQAEMAVSVTRRIVGVQKVVKLFEYV
ncbi:BON domain-containing protein [soil metagenome]